MASLKHTKETVISVDVYDLEDFIKQVTGHTYECIAREEWNNDSHHRFYVDDEMKDWHTKNWESFKADGTSHYHMLRTILMGLCSEKHIEPGIYMITVSW